METIHHSGFTYSLVFPGHDLHEKFLLGQIGVVTLVISQERRALAVLLLNRLSTADEPVVNRGFCSFVGVTYDLDCSCFRRDVQDSFFRTLVCSGFGFGRW